jgi:osmoprotectant transport system permease protein
MTVQKKQTNGFSLLWRGITDPLLWMLLLLAGLLVSITSLDSVFSALFPHLDRPVYRQDSFWMMFNAHLTLVFASSVSAAVLGVSAGIGVTRMAGKEFRPLVETCVAIGQIFPPVVVLAITVPVMGFNEKPAVITLALYGLLPILQGTIAGITSVPSGAYEVAAGLGMNTKQILLKVELPLAAPAIVSGIRTSVIINTGTATVASLVGIKTLGLPIIIGINGFNPAYVIQGACVVALLAIIIDMAFERLIQRLSVWRDE